MQVVVQLLLLLLVNTQILAIENNKKCSEDEYRCLNGNCIPASKKCDSHQDCSMGEDEHNCPAGSCEPGLFLCDNGHCISSFWVCDGSPDCFDHSDEKNCTKKADSDNTDPEEHCNEGHFKCPGGLCLPPFMICDGEDDCEGAEDEDPVNCAKKEWTGCEAGFFECEKENCIPHRWLCDGSPDCDNSRDEGDHCGEFREDCDLEKGLFSCGNSTNSRCLESQYVCDGHPQCPKGLDEGPFCEQQGCNTTACSHSCMESPKGPQCFCPEGLKLGATGHDCIDVNECEEYGVCSQICHNIYEGFGCDCHEGYSMVNSSCIAEGDDPMLYISTRTSIRSYNVRTDTYKLVAGELAHVVGVGYDSQQDRVYWTDANKKGELVESIYSSGSGRRVLLDNGLGVPEDIVIDDISRNFYFSDSQLGHIVACTLDGTVCTIIEDNNDNPRGLAIHYRENLLFYSDWGSKPAIVRIGLDGSDRVELVTEDISWPNGVAVDQVLNQVYWSDAKLDRLEAINLDGSGRRIVLNGMHLLHPFSLAIFEDTLYWSDWEGGLEDGSGSVLTSCNKFTGKNKKTILKEPGLDIMGITIYHPLLKEDLTHSCDGHSCSHMCLPKATSSLSFSKYVCACPTEMELDSDGKTCMTSGRNSLIVAVRDELFAFNPHSVGKASFDLVGQIDDEVGSMAFDMTGNIYINEPDTESIFLYDLEKKTRSEIANHADLYSLVFDKINENLYFIDPIKKQIVVQSAVTKAKKTIVDHLLNPKALAYCGKHGLVFIDENKLVRTSLDGKQQIFLADLPKNVRQLYYAEGNDTLLLGDSDARLVHEFNFNNHELVIFLSGFQGSIVSMAVHNGYFFWTQKTGYELFWIKFHKGVSFTEMDWMSMEKISDNPLDLVHLGVSSNLTEIYKDTLRPCSDAFCEQLCLPSEGSPVCSCEFGHVLLEDNKSCQGGCPNSTFSCEDSSNRCIKHDWVCDGTEDCGNGLDEEDCSNTSTCDPDRFFQCDDGSCILNHWACDGAADCNDSSDEANCTSQVPCDTDGDFFLCASKGQCILKIWKCDNFPDCYDGSDEQDCEAADCEGDMFSCDNQCMPNRWLCDGRSDCLDGRDEINCTIASVGCGDNMFECGDGNCIDADLVCDKEIDCGDGSDEEKSFCNYKEESNAMPVICDGFLCGFQCLPHTARCNGTSECADDSDEVNCQICTPDTWRCKNGMSCISPAWKCDGAFDCEDGSDEEDCLAPRIADATCQPHQYRCNTGECIAVESACNGFADCEDGSDEAEHRCQVCEQNNGGCHHDCHPTPYGAVCSCRQGFQFKKEKDTVVCEDIDECSNPMVCAQECINFKGSFKCSCTEGFVSESGGTVCRAEGGSPKLLYATESHIKGTELDSFNFHLYANYSAYIKSFAVNQLTGEIFATLPSRNQIMRVMVDNLSSNRPTMVSNELWIKTEKPSLVEVDWVTGNLYFTSQNSDVIKVCTARNCTALLKAPLAHITGLAVDPTVGRIFVSAFRNSYLTLPVGGVWTFTLDGKIDGIFKLSGPKLTMPLGLTLDIHKQTVYWTDRNRRMLMSNSYSGKSLHLVEMVNSVPSHLATFQNNLYWIKENGAISILDALTTVESEAPQSGHLAPNSHSIRIIQDQQQPRKSNPCEGSPCSHLCLLSVEGRTACACPTGYITSSEDKNQCQLISTAVVTQSADVSISVEEELSTYKPILSEDGVNKELVDQGSSATGAIVGFVVLFVVLVLGSILLFLYCRNKRSNKAEDMVGFMNSSGFGLEEENKTNNNTADPVVKRGTIVSCDNPMFSESPVNTPSSARVFSSKLDFFKYGRQPRMSSIDFTDSPLAAASGASTPTMKRKDAGDRDSAFMEPSMEPSASIDYEDLTHDQHLSVSFHQDKLRLIAD